MVELPSFSKAVVTSEAPRPVISPGEVAKPYEEMANALDKAGQGLEAVATPLAERAGAEAVTRDADGKIQVERMPIFGLAGQAYARAMKTAALAEADGQADRQDIAIRQQYRDNPEGYAAAAQAFKDKSVKDMTAAAGPEVGVALGRSIDSRTTTTYRGLLNEKERLDLARADSSISAGINSASDDAMALARGGAKLDDPAMTTALDKRNSLLQEKLNNPRLAYTKEQLDYDQQNFTGQLAGERNAYHVGQVYKTQGYEAAMEAAKDVLTNPNYKLTEPQRKSLYSQATNEVRANEAIRRQDISELRNDLYMMKSDWSDGNSIPPDRIQKLRDQAVAKGWTAGASQIDAFFNHRDLHDAFGRQSIPEMTRQVDAIKGSVAARQGMQFFMSKGYTAQQSAGIMGNLISESSTFNPAQVHDQGIGLGIAGWNRERLVALRQYAASQGKPVTDLQTQFEFVARELQTSESAVGARLRLAGTPEQAGNIMLGYERPKDFNIPGAHPERAQNARMIYNATQGGPVEGGPGLQSWLIANRAAALSDATTRAVKQSMDDFASGKGAMPTPKQLNEFADAARASGNIDLQAKISGFAQNVDELRRISQMPLPMQTAAETELRRQMREGTAFPGADMVEKILTDRTNALRKGLEENPIATAVANYSNQFKTPMPLDFDNPQNLAAGLKQNAQIAQTAAEIAGTGPLSIIDKTDMPRLQTALQDKNGPQILATLSQLPADQMQTLLREEPLRAAVTGMSRSGDPAKMNAAYSFMDTLQKQNPLQFDAQFKDGLKDLRAWQSNLSFYPPDVAAKRMMAAYDPAEQAGRAAVDKVVDKALASVSPAQVVSKFSTGIVFGTSARAPVTEQAGIATGALKADYDQNYRDGFIATGDPAAAENFAMEKLNLKYALSPTNGNRVMPYAPERYYPQVNGSHDWMGAQLDEAVRNQLKVKPPEPTLATGIEPGAFTDQTSAQRQYEARRSLVSDVTTERDIAAGKPPSYQVIIQDPNGRWTAMSGPDGTASRFRFDPKAEQDKHAAGAEFVRPTVLGLQRPMLGGVTP